MRPYKRKGRAGQSSPREAGAGKESRTPDLNLGKVALYQLSYSRGELELYHRLGVAQLWRTRRRLVSMRRERDAPGRCPDQSAGAAVLEPVTAAATASATY